MNIGIDIGGTHIACGLVEKDGKIVSKIEKDFSAEEKKDIEASIEKIIVNSIGEILKENSIDIGGIEKIGLSIPGTCNKKTVIWSNNLGIRNFNIVDILSKYYPNKTIAISNDAKCAAMCEKKLGSLKNYDDAIFICLGTGVGGAVFLNRRIIKNKEISRI